MAPWAIGNIRWSVWLSLQLWNLYWVPHLVIGSCLPFFPCSPVSPRTGFAKDEKPGCQILSLCPGREAVLFSKKLFFFFFTWGIFTFLLWEVASSFPKNILYLLFKQGALEELWSLKGVGVLWSPLFHALMWAEMQAVYRQKSQSLPGLGSGMGCRRRDSLGSKSWDLFKHLVYTCCER